MNKESERIVQVILVVHTTTEFGEI